MEHPYRKFALVITINAIVMFFVMYATLYSLEHFYFNINRLYMTLMMVAPMVILMLIVMRGMYQNKTLNLVLGFVFAAVFVICLLLVRTQTPVGDAQFLRSMIPHHSGAILMCRQAEITDPEIKDLCDRIIESQKQEIAEMEELLMEMKPR
jgi:signal transduction histidine kinase